MQAPVLCVVLALATGCGSSKDEAQPMAAPTGPAGIAVHYDTQRVATATVAAVTERTSLMDVVEEEYRDRTAWAVVDARSSDGRKLTIPVDKYADHDPALYPGDDGALAFGWFAETTGKDEVGPRLSITNVAEIYIVTAEAASELDRAGGIRVAVGGAAAEPVLASKIRRLAVHRKGERGANKKAKIRGRSLRDLVGLAADIGEIASVTVRVGDASHTFAAEELAVDNGQNVLFRLDRRGNLIVRWLLDTGQREQFRNIEVVEVALRQ